MFKTIPCCDVQTIDSDQGGVPKSLADPTNFISVVSFYIICGKKRPILEF